MDTSTKKADMASKLIGERRKAFLPHETTRAAFPSRRNACETRTESFSRFMADLVCAGRPRSRSDLARQIVAARAKANRSRHQSQSIPFPAVGATTPVLDPPPLFQVTNKEFNEQPTRSLWGYQQSKDPLDTPKQNDKGIQ